jgi:DNA-binding NarL/FixJ family response regulator
MKEVRILVADDHEIVRHGLRRLLETQPGWKICGEASSGREAVAKALQCKPDVAVLDFGMPELNGAEAARRILKSSPTTEILILTMHDTEQLVREVLAAGARGYVLKSDASRDLVVAVQTLLAHKPFLSPTVSKLVVEGYLHGSVLETRTERLTAREREIVQLVAEGKSNKEVAAALNISIKTVEAHRSHVMHKLGVASVTELVRYAIRNKIVEP